MYIEVCALGTMCLKKLNKTTLKKEFRYAPGLLFYPFILAFIYGGLTKESIAGEQVIFLMPRLAILYYGAQAGSIE